MTEVCVRPDFLLALLTEIGKHRALADHETDLIEDLVMLDVTPFRWNARLENQLLTASASTGGIARFARRHGIDKMTAHQKLFRLRRTRANKTRKA